MFDHKHYVPILKTKTGERWAVENLKGRTKLQITPLFEFHNNKKLSIADHAATICDELVAAWGIDRPFFLDTVWLQPKNGNGYAGIIKAVFDACRQRGLQAIPVARLDFTQAALDAVHRIVQKNDRGYLLRLARSEIRRTPDIAKTTAAIGLPQKSIHLMLDYRTSEMALGDDLPRIPNIAQWKTLTAASSAFPRSLTGFTQGTWHQVPRDDWLGWLKSVTESDLPRRPAYGDYTMRDPGAPAEFGEASLNLRYTKSAFWLVRVGPKFKSGASAQMHRICRELVARPEYDGPAFSQGDQRIYDTVDPKSGPGGPTQWLQWCVNHHIEFTTQNIRNHPAL